MLVRERVCECVCVCVRESGCGCGCGCGCVRERARARAKERERERERDRERAREIEREGERERERERESVCVCVRVCVCARAPRERERERERERGRERQKEKDVACIHHAHTHAHHAPTLPRSRQQAFMHPHKQTQALTHELWIMTRAATMWVIHYTAKSAREQRVAKRVHTCATWSGRVSAHSSASARVCRVGQVRPLGFVWGRTSGSVNGLAFASCLFTPVDDV